VLLLITQQCLSVVVFPSTKIFVFNIQHDFTLGCSRRNERRRRLTDVHVHHVDEPLGRRLTADDVHVVLTTVDEPWQRRLTAVHVVPTTVDGRRRQRRRRRLTVVRVVDLVLVLLADI